MARKAKVEMEKPVVVLPEIKYDDIVFFNRKRQGSRAGCGDVHVTLIKSKSGNRIHVSINKNVEIVYKGTDFLEVGVVQNRMYFRKSDSKNGFKLTYRDFGAGILFTISPREKEILEQFADSYYSMKHDDVLDLYYIEIKEARD